MVEIKLSLEGEETDIAAEKLFETTGLQGSWEIAANSVTTKEGTLAVIGTVVGIVGGTVAVAEQIRKWYQEHKRSHKKFDVVLVVDDVRVVLENATIEDICAVLEELES
jgi:Na+/glutamate symporter